MSKPELVYYYGDLYPSNFHFNKKARDLEDAGEYPEPGTKIGVNEVKQAIYPYGKNDWLIFKYILIWTGNDVMSINEERWDERNNS